MHKICSLYLMEHVFLFPDGMGLWGQSPLDR